MLKKTKVPSELLQSATEAAQRAKTSDGGRKADRYSQAPTEK
jgi:hypothetical protein